MINRIEILKENFSIIIEIRKNIKIIFEILEQKIIKLKQIYNDFIKQNHTQLFIFCLDSFYFQSKMIDIEYEDMKRLFLAMNNKMYCEYYKLHKIIITYIKENINDKKIIETIKINNYPIYKDLEPFKEYEFDLINDIHQNVFEIILLMLTYIENKEKELIMHTSKKNIGLNIDNFINTFNYDIIIIREKIYLFLKYIEFFHKQHIKHFKRFNNKMQLMYNELNNDINFDEQIITEERITNIENISSNEKKEKDDSCDSIKTEETNLNSLNDSIEMNEQIDMIENKKDINKKEFKTIFKNNVNKVRTILNLKNITKDNDKNQNLNINNVCDSINNICESFIVDENIQLNIIDNDSEQKLNSDF